MALSILLTMAVLSASIPSGVAQDEPQPNDELYASLEDQFTAELFAYAANHTDDEVKAYAQMRLNQLTSEAYDNPEGTSSTLLAPSSSEPTSSTTSYPDPYWYGEETGDYEFCVRTRSEECRQLYNAELFASAAGAATIFAGCLALTTGSGLILCAAAALATHAANIAAARQRYQGCLTRTYSDCVLQFKRS
jgi:hypothetical protein